MNNIRSLKAAAGVALLAMCSFTAFAQSSDQAPATQDPPAGGQPGSAPHGQWRGAPGPDRELNQLTRVLNLTSDQQKGVRAVLEQQGEQMRAMHQKSQTNASGEATPAATETPETRRAQMEQLRDESNTKIAALLDENQKKTFADWTAKRKAMMEQRRQQGAPSPDGAGSPPPPPPNEN